MIKDTHKTRVLFVYPRYPHGQREILALFPDHKESRPDTIGCYARVGQHGNAHPSFMRRKRATPDQYSALARELEGLGYNLTIL